MIALTNDRQIMYISSISENNVKNVEIYLSDIVKDYKFDSYDQDKDNTIIGLFSRILRLYVMIMEKPELWPADLIRIILRSLTETCINYSYLISKNDPTLYEAFIKYGSEKEKLLLLHLQDNHKDRTGPTGEDIDLLTALIGGDMKAEVSDATFEPNWSDKNIRGMAEEIGMIDIYRTIYDPTSSDVHGTWPAVRLFNLCECKNPLHRRHLIPSIYKNISIVSLNLATEIINRVIDLSQRKLLFPINRDKLKSFDVNELNKLA